jgi:hypothetical protein
MAVGHPVVDALGWTATSVFVASYFLASPRAVRRTQMAGALIWLTYGLLIDARPVIVANVLVAGAAAWSLVRPGASRLPDGTPEGLGHEQP